jgi:hypothetical protein
VGGDKQSAGIGGRGMVGSGFCAGLARVRLTQMVSKFYWLVIYLTSKS